MAELCVATFFAIVGGLASIGIIVTEHYLKKGGKL